MTEPYYPEKYANMIFRMVLEHKDHGGWEETSGGVVCIKDGEVVTPTSSSINSWWDKHAPLRCFCGDLLHYSNETDREMVQKLVDTLGRYQKITVEDSGAYMVDRHYTALHGVKAQELPDLGFERVA